MGSQMVNSLWLTGLELVMNLFGSSMMPMLEMVSGSTGSFSMFLYGAVLAPISEELLFRGYILRALRPYGKRFAILGSAILFGLFHGNLLQGPYAMLVGLVIVPMVSLMTRKSVSANVNEIFSCYDRRVEVPIGTSLEKD
jgi:membrane protease YdiL (CAAX protease family)